jgi:hypothetical protein
MLLKISLMTWLFVAELMKISSCADKRTWDLLVQNGEALIKTRFGRADGAPPELKAVADEICWRGIKVMLDVRWNNFVAMHIADIIPSLSLPTCMRLVWIVSSPLATACHPPSSSHLSYLFATAML